MNNIKTILDEQGRSQVWLADRIGVSAGTIANWIHGDTEPLRSQSILLCDLLGVSDEDVWPQ